MDLAALVHKVSWQKLGFGVVIFNILVSWVASLALGGFKVGSLERTITQRVRRFDYEAFVMAMRERLANLGFTMLQQDQVYRQGRAEQGDDVKSFTHANAKKELVITYGEEGGDVLISLSLRYLDPIVGDTGESAYRDGVLAYVSQQADSIPVITNRSYSAFSSCVGGTLTLLFCFLFKSLEVTPLFGVIVISAATDIAIGIMGLKAILQRPAELTGRAYAIVGIILSIAAMAVAWL